MIPQYHTFKSPKLVRERMKQAIYEISTAVTDFFWDDAPLKYGLEAREGQQEMAFDILDAIRRGQHITVEAGVGIGKSFAYLVPLLLYNQQTRLPVVIATSTIALQEQLLDDVKRLSPMLGVRPDVLLAKVQTHYVCKRRVEAFFSSPEGQPHARIRLQIDQGGVRIAGHSPMRSQAASGRRSTSFASAAGNAYSVINGAPVNTICFARNYNLQPA